MRRRRRLVGFGSFFALVAVIAACGLIVSGSAQAAGSTTYDVGGSSLFTNITLNGVPGNQLSVEPGADVTLAADWSDHHSGCPGCIDFAAVAYAGSAGAAGCIENNGRVGQSGSGSVDLGDAPTTPGTYYIIGEFLEVYYCAQDYSPTDPGLNIIGEITVGPTISLTTPPSPAATYTYGEVVDASYTCAPGVDATLVSCSGTAADNSPINTTTVGSNSFSVTALDSDGLSLTTTHTYNVTALPPTVTLTTPPTGTPTYTYGQVVDANYSCTAGGGSTLSSCVAPVANGSPINTTSLGSNSFTVTATDADSQTATVTNSYTVVAAPTSLEAWPQLIEYEPFVGIGSGVVAATLTSGGHPVSGQTIYFTVGSTPLCHANTNASGFAICPISAANQALLYRTNYYSASYSTTSDYTGTTATTPVVTFF